MHIDVLNFNNNYIIFSLIHLFWRIKYTVEFYNYYNILIKTYNNFQTAKYIIRETKIVIIVIGGIRKLLESNASETLHWNQIYFRLTWVCITKIGVIIIGCRNSHIQ